MEISGGQNTEAVDITSYNAKESSFLFLGVFSFHPY